MQNRHRRDALTLLSIIMLLNDFLDALVTALGANARVRSQLARGVLSVRHHCFVTSATKSFSTTLFS